MSTSKARIVDVSDRTPRPQRIWPPTLVTRAEIARTIEHLADIGPPASGRRCARIIHPWATAPGLGFAPGIDVTISVLKPGEQTSPIRRNSSQVEICIGGKGVVTVEDNEPLTVEKWDVWNVPSMKAYGYRNTGNTLMVRLSYSDAPLLEALEVHFVEQNPMVAGAGADGTRIGGSGAGNTKADSSSATSVRLRDSAPDFPLETGGWLRGYQYAVDVDVVETRAPHWPWRAVAPHLPLKGAGHPTTPMGMFLLYNPATERTSGTTHSFFTTLTCLKENGPRPKAGGRGHRHNSAAINYHMTGRGYSVVDGQRIDWAEGDLLLSAPGMTGPILNIGAQTGFNSTGPRNDLKA